MNEIRFEYKDKEYVLTFTRESIMRAEDEGLDISKAESKILNTTWLLFRASFYANHSDTPEHRIQEIYDLLDDKQGVFEKLVLIYSKAVESLMADNKSKNAIKWTANF